MKVLVDEGIRNFSKIAKEIDSFYGIEFIYADHKEINNNLLLDIDILFVRSTTQINECLLRSTKVKLVGSATAGFDHIDTNYLNSKRIEWFYSPGCNSSSVVHYVMSSIAYLHSINKINLEKETIGIIGYGNVGSKLHNVLNALNIKNVSYDPYRDFQHLCSIEDIMKSEVISIHVPLTHNVQYPTFNMVDKFFLEQSQVKTLINTSRGSIVNEKDLLDIKDINYIADVWEHEPEPYKKIIDRAVIATPHIAGHSYEGKINGTLNLLLTLLKYININKEAFKKDSELIASYKSKHLMDTNQLKLHHFSETYNIHNESCKFKDLIKISNKKLQATSFIKIRADHLKRHDIF